MPPSAGATGPPAHPDLAAACSTHERPAHHRRRHRRQQLPERLDHPILSPEHEYEKRGIEDPRITLLEGIYYLFYFGMPTSGVVGLEGDFRINEFILRHMVTKIIPKLSEAILAVGRDPNAFCFQSVTEPPEEDLFDNDRDRDRDRNRRRRPAPEAARSEDLVKFLGECGEKKSRVKCCLDCSPLVKGRFFHGKSQSSVPDWSPYSRS